MDDIGDFFLTHAIKLDWRERTVSPILSEIIANDHLQMRNRSMTNALYSRDSELH